MPASYCHVPLHIIFSTRNWHPTIAVNVSEDLYAYIAGIIINLKGVPVIINGIENHIHILCFLPKDISIADFMRIIKANSSKWFREKYNPGFHWQDGYAAYAVSKSSLKQVEKYICSQKEHHNHQTGSEEFEELLQRHLKQ